MPDILVLRALGLGDFLTGVPALRALRNGFPGHRLVLAAPRSLGDLANLAGVADELVDQHGLAELTWSREPPQIAVNLHGEGPQSHALLQRTAPSRLVAFGCAAVDHCGPEWDPAEHEVARWCRLVSEVLGLEADPADLHIRGPRSAAPERRRTAVLHPGAAYESRRWPVERWAQIGRYLTDRGLEVVLTGDRSEVSLVGAVADRAGLPADRCLAGKTSLPQLVEWISAARVLVCGDTGVAHLATALGTPSVLLFGPTSPQRWGPPAGGRHRVLWHGDGTGDPWGEHPDPALLRITAGEVRASLDELLGELDAELPREPAQRPG